MTRPRHGAAPRGRPLDEPVEREHRERQPRRQQQLNVRRPREDVRAERERDGGNGGRAAIARQVLHQVVHADDAEAESEQHDEVVRRVRILRRPVDGNREEARAEIVLRVCERAAMRIEDVRVEHVQRIHDERPRDPGDVPDREFAVAAVDAADAAHLERDRIGECGGAGSRWRRETRASSRLEVIEAPGTAVKRISTPRFRVSCRRGSRRYGTNPSVDRAESRQA